MSDTSTTTHAVGYLVPTATEVEESGQASGWELGPWAGKPILVVLRIDEAVEQESLHVSIWGSADGASWGSQALFWFPQKFYSGVTPAALNLTQRPDLKYLQARWEVNRWGRGIPRPRFRFSVEAQESVIS